MIRGDRTVGASVRNQPLQTISFASVGGVPFTDRTLQDNVVGQIFYEGQQVPFVLQRSGTEAQIDRELEVRVRYYEPYHPYVDAQVAGRTFNPSEQLIFITFPAGNTEAGGTFDVSIDDVDETLEEGVTVGQDWMALYVNPPIFSGYGSTYISVHTGVTTNIHENPQAVSISRADDDSSIDEGETAEFLLTRHGSTSTALTLNVSIDDPGDFRRGNHWRNTPDQIVPVRFSEGSATATLSVPTQDDWRDIPDNTITATIPPSQDGSYRPAYEAEGESSASVTVRDNDVAPHISLSASTTTVVEGQAASFTLTRNDTENRLLVRLLFGPQGEEQFQTYTWDENKSQITVDLVTEDDDYDDPDETVYVLSLIPSTNVPRDELSQYWIVEGPSSATITVTDNDLPLVWVNPIENSYLRGSYREGEVAAARLERDGQFLRELTVNVRWFEAADPDAGDYSHRTLSDVEETFIWALIRTAVKTVPGGDGDEGDGLMGLKLLPGEGYRIDEERSSRTFTVIDADPTPVLIISAAAAAEGDGTIDFKVSIESTVSPPSRREMSVSYTTSGRSAESGSDYIGTSERLLIPPLATSTIISIPLVDDALVEEEEYFSLLLYRPYRAEMQDGQETLSVTGTITDDEPSVSVSPLSDEVDEGDTAVFEFVRTGTTTEALTVYFTRSYQYYPGSGYLVGPTRSIVIPAGQTSVQWAFETRENEEDAQDSRFAVTVRPATWEGHTYYYRHDAAPAEVTIKDDDLPVVSVEADSEGVHESYNADFTLTRVGRKDIALTVDITVTREGSFFTNEDPPSTITFPVGSATATLTVATVGDSTLEDHGSVTVAVAEGDDYEVGLPASATTTVADNDRGGVSVSIAVENAAVEEGENVVFTVTRSGGNDLDAFTVRVNVFEVRDEVPWIGDEEKLAEFVTLYNADGLDSGGTHSVYSVNRYDVRFAAGSTTADPHHLHGRRELQRRQQLLQGGLAPERQLRGKPLPRQGRGVGAG